MNIREIYRSGISLFKLSINKSVWGIEIGDKGLKAVKASVRNGELFVETISKINYSSIINKNMPDNPELVEEAVRILKERNLINNSDRIIVSISGKMMLSRFFTLPPLKKQLINNVLKFELRKQIPFEPDEIIWDYQLLNGNSTVNKEVKVVLFATKRENIYDLLTCFAPIRANLDAIQITPVAIYNLVHFISDSDEEAIIIKVENANTDFIVAGKSRYWNRSIPVSEINMVFIREIQRSIGYYSSISKGFKPDMLYLFGNVFDADKIKFLEENMEFNVMHLKVLEKIIISKDVDNHVLTNKNICGFETALGLTLQGLNLSKIKINLLPRDYVKNRQSSRQKISICIILISIFIGFFTQSIKDYIEWISISHSTDTATEVLQKVEKFERTYNDIKNKTEMEEENLKVLKSVGNQGFFLIEAINKIINSIPENVFLISIESLWDIPKPIKKNKTDSRVLSTEKRDTTLQSINKPKEVLILIVKGESHAPEVSYIEKNVKKRMADLTLLNQKIPLFSDVILLQDSLNHVTVLNNNDIKSRPIFFEIHCIANAIN